MLKEIGIKNIITAIFVFAAVIGLLAFSGIIKFGNDSNTARGTVTVWGTVPYATMQKYIDQSKTAELNIIYQVQDPATYEDDLVNAFAAGEGPDLFIMPHENILRHSDKIFEIPYASFPKTRYEATYIDEAKLFLTDTGVKAIPMTVDPLVMYYNKNLIASSFLLYIPEYWDELLPFVGDINVVDANGSIKNSGVALGTFDNILNAKGIISTLLLQNGNDLVGPDPISGQMRPEISLNEDTFETAKQALEFYTSFSAFGTQNYSWNEALSLSREKFIAGELALYFGKASEIERISNKNPNLNFDVALMPQISETSLKSTYGSMVGIAIAKQTKNIAASIHVASKLSSKDVLEKLSAELSVAPARKDLLAEKPDNEHLTLFYNSAIISDGWIDPDPDATEQLFKNLVRSINTGSLSVGDALQRANADLEIILNRTINTTIKDKTIEE